LSEEIVMRLLLLLALLLPAGLAAQPVVRPLVLDHGVTWSFDHDGRRPVVYRAGSMTLTLRGVRRGELTRLLLTVAQRGMAPVTLRGEEVFDSFEQHLRVGRWDAHSQYLMFQSFSGGAHCCNHISLVLPLRGRLRVVDLGSWDGDYEEEAVRDLNRDGRLDFVFADNRFLYAFTPYAGSYAPPQVLNVVNGRVIDVSANPAFRAMNEAAARDAREPCVHHDSQGDQNGACAAYVAAAARIGRFDGAWAEMLQSYQRDSNWELPAGCRIDDRNRLCPAADLIHYRNYPDALRHFLIRYQYIRSASRRR
jgi:hypothetical protein